MSSRLNVFDNSLVKVGQFAIAALLITTAMPQQASAQTVSASNPSQLSDNVANQGSPTVIMYGGSAVTYYVNHSNNVIWADVGTDSNNTSTGISVESRYITDVGAAVLGSDVLLSYINTSDQACFALSSNGTSFSSPATPSASALGLPSGVSINYELTPALTSDGTTVYVATVGSDNKVYTSYTTDGSTFTPLIGTGTSVSSLATISRPSLTMYGGSPYVAFTESTYRQAVVGLATSSSLGVVLSGNYWGQNNRTYYAGLALLSYNGYLYAFGQDTSASQYLRYMYYNGSSWAGTYVLSYLSGIQMRWTPSLVPYSASFNVLVYQDDSNTNISVSDVN